MTTWASREKSMSSNSIRTKKRKKMREAMRKITVMI
jgi:hypothetical protein